jgi:hypothetical protein
LHTTRGKRAEANTLLENYYPKRHSRFKNGQNVVGQFFDTEFNIYHDMNFLKSKINEKVKQYENLTSPPSLSKKDFSCIIPRLSFTKEKQFFPVLVLYSLFK